MNSTARWLAVLATGLSLVLLPACASQLEPFPGQAAFDQSVARAKETTHSPLATAERLVIRSGEIAIAVDEPEQYRSEVESLIAAVDGFVQQSVMTEDAVSMTCRVPAASLEETVEALARLGEVVRRSIHANDVTDQHADLFSRLESSRVLRDRMRRLLDRATKIEDLLRIESELSRIQYEIEAMESQLARLDGQIEMSTLSVRLEQDRVLGPVGFVGYWSYWALSKLFVLR